MSPYRYLKEIVEDPGILEPPKAIIPRLMFQGRRTIFAGREKLGKSTILAQGVVAVSNGGLFLGERCDQATIIWVGLEEPVADTARRFIEMGANPERIVLVDSLDQDWLRDIISTANETEAVGMVIDSYAMLLSHVGIKDENDAGPVNFRIIRPLTTLIRDTGVAVTFTAHARKEDGKYRGSSALGAGVDLIVEMFSTKNTKTERAYECRGRVPTEDFKTEFNGQDYSLSKGTLSLRARVVDHIDNNPSCTTRNIRDALGGNAKAVQGTLQQLANQDKIFNYGDAKVHKWRSLPDQTEIDLGTTNGSAVNPVKPRTEPLHRTTSVPNFGGGGSEVRTSSPRGV